MAGLSNFWRNTLLSHGFGKEVYVHPTNYYVALSTTEPSGDGSGVSEPSGNGYARASTLPSDWSEVSSFEIQNLNDVIFPTSTGSWGTVDWFVIYDALSGGNMLAYGDLSEPTAIPSGKVPSFGPGDLSVTH